MKVSILLPSLFPELGVRAIDAIRSASRGIEYEIVLVSPYALQGPQLVHVREDNPSGAVQATRAAFEASSGEYVVTLPDDWHPSPGWLQAGLQHLLEQERRTPLFLCGFPLWAPEGYWCGTVFGMYYPYTPLCRRTTANAIGGFFSPDYRGGWADPDLALRVWAAGGRCGFCPGTYVVPFSARDRVPEGPEKYRSFQRDMDTFKTRWGSSFGVGWGAGFQDFNIDLPMDRTSEQSFSMNDPQEMRAFLEDLRKPRLSESFTGDRNSRIRP